jgi:hypothetical protein
MDSAKIVMRNIKTDRRDVMVKLLLKPFVNRVNRRCCMQSVKFCRST